MMRQVFELSMLPWRVTVFYASTSYKVDEITDALMQIGCTGEHIETAIDNILSGNADTGLTYSNYSMRESVVVISKASSQDEYMNSIVHELHHLATHIATAYGIPLDSEEVCYIAGETGQKMYPYAIRLLCNCYRRREY